MHFCRFKPPGCGLRRGSPGGQRAAHPCPPRATLLQRPAQEADVAGMGMIPILLCGRLAGRPWQLTSSLRASGLSAVQWARCSPCTTPHSGCSHSGCPAHLWWARPLPPARPCPDLPFDGHTFPSSLAPHTPLLPLSPSPGPSAPWLAEAPRMSLTAAFLGLDCVCPVTHPSTWSQGPGQWGAMQNLGQE